MKYRYWMAGALLILGLLAVYLHRSRYVAITVSNVGDLDLQAVVAHIGGNNIQLGSIIPGASARGSTVPQADSDVSLTFKTGGDVVELHLNSYVTGMRGHACDGPSFRAGGYVP